MSSLTFNTTTARTANRPLNTYIPFAVSKLLVFGVEQDLTNFRFEMTYSNDWVINVYAASGTITVDKPSASSPASMQVYVKCIAKPVS